MSEPKPQADWAPGQAWPVGSLISIAKGAVVSRTLMKRESGTVTLFAFDEGQGLSEHSAPFDALVYILEGRMELKIGGIPVTANAGDLTVMPATIPHALQAVQPTKMMLVMIKG